MLKLQKLKSWTVAVAIVVVYGVAVHSGITDIASSGSVYGQEGDVSTYIEYRRAADTALADGDSKAALAAAKKLAEAFPDSPPALQAAAEVAYLSANCEASLPWFDRVVELVPEQAAQNWQRGIALATCGRFKEGAEQFKTHHDVNPNDVENSAWYFLCVAKTKGLAAARKTVIPSQGDGREPMMTILKMLKGEAEPSDVSKKAEAEPAGRRRELAQMYADLYIGLYHDSLGESKQAAVALKRAETRKVDNYMSRTASVYRKARFSKSASQQKPKDK